MKIVFEIVGFLYQLPGVEFRFDYYVGDVVTDDDTVARNLDENCFYLGDG